jgi:hypothetical protein
MLFREQAYFIMKTISNWQTNALYQPNGIHIGSGVKPITYPKGMGFFLGAKMGKG